jgi:hypothetical protein
MTRPEESPASGTTADPAADKLCVLVEAAVRDTKPNLNSYLVTSGYAESEDDAFDIAMRGLRSDGIPSFEPRNVDLKD